MRKAKKLLARLVMSAYALAAMFAMPPLAAAGLTYATVVTSDLSSASAGSSLLLKNGESFTYQLQSGLSSSFTALVEYSCDNANYNGFSVAISSVGNQNGSTFSGNQAAPYCPGQRTWVRWRVSDFSTGVASTTLTEIENVIDSKYNHAGQDVRDIKDGGVLNFGYLTAQGGINSFGNPVVVSTGASGSGALSCHFIGAVASLPTSGYNECDTVYQTSDHLLYVATETVTAATSWKSQ